jgi:peptidyl-prolyl cis-trans isomerase B (cyclophilin B)
MRSMVGGRRNRGGAHGTRTGWRAENCYDRARFAHRAREGENMKVRLTTSMGIILLELDAGKAPITVENFVTYVRDGHYDGTLFHRVISDFMIQGGGLDKDMGTKPTRASIKNEADNGLKNDTGTIAMARTSDPHSATAQFFINTTMNTFLNYRSATPDGWGYCVFGKVSGGMDVVEDIEDVKTTRRKGFQDVPDTPVLIEKAEIVDR